MSMSRILKASIHQDIRCLLTWALVTVFFAGGISGFLLKGSSLPFSTSEPVKEIVMESLIESACLGGRMEVEMEWSKALLTDNWEQSYKRLRGVREETESRHEVLEKMIGLLKLHELVGKGDGDDGHTLP